MPKTARREPAFIHPLAQVEKGARIGDRTRVWQFAIIKAGARVGRNCNIGAHCFIEGGTLVGDNVTVKNDVALWEGVEIEDGVLIGPNAIFTNDVYPRSRRLAEARRPVISKTRLRYGSSVSAGAMVLAGVTVGRFATLGMGAVVLKSVPDHALMIGNPARRIGWVCECGYGLTRQGELRWDCRCCGGAYLWTGKALRKTRGPRRQKKTPR